MRKELEHVHCGDKIVDKIISTWPKLAKAEDAEPFVQDQVDTNGVSYIKRFHELGDTIGMDLPRPPMEIQEAVVEAAHNRGVITIGHAFSYAGTMDLLRAGVDGLSHMYLDAAPDDEWVENMLQRGQFCNSTLGLCASQTGEGVELQVSFVRDSFTQQMLIQKETGKALGLAASQCPRSSIAHGYTNTRALYEAGVPILVGTDCAGNGLGLPYGLGVHLELHVLVHQVGMSPLDVLKSATSVTADQYKFRDRGRFVAGNKADFVLVEGDVFEVLADTNARCLPIRGVWRDGVQAPVFQQL